MPRNPIPLITVCLLMSFLATAQRDSAFTLQLRSGKFIPVKNIDAASVEAFDRDLPRIDGIGFIIIQFDHVPGEKERLALQQQGIQIGDYISGYAYSATVNASLKFNFLNEMHVRALVKPSPEQKMQPQLSTGKFPSWAVKAVGTLQVRVSYPAGISYEKVVTKLKEENFDIVSTEYKKYRVLTLQIATQRLKELASLPIIEFVEAAPPADHELNSNSRFVSRANTLNAAVSNGGLGLSGNGVTVGVGDNGDVQSHIDFNGRLINRAANIFRGHAAHVTGTVGGAGIIQELYTGFAPKTRLVSQIYSNIISNAPTYVQDYGMVITNNSYGSIEGDAAYSGIYDYTSRILDQQAFDMPELQQVFAAGNDGDKTYAPYAPAFHTVLGGYQSAKNTITVGSIDYHLDIHEFSSRGPVNDGRVKPDIMAQGKFVASTWINNAYSYNNGTSMAAPAVSGGLALLIEQYRKQHANANPKSALLKALIINSGARTGTIGPDYSFGYGIINLERAANMLMNAHYFESSLTTATTTTTHTITVPANTAALKVLLYWPDPPASPFAAHTLVNDLDLSVITPANGTLLPYVLDTTYSQIQVPATMGHDHLNNVEQVTLANPIPGTYTLNIAGILNQNPTQPYFIAYDFVPQGLRLTNPFGGEYFVPSTNTTLDSLYLQWDANDGMNNTFKLEFSADNGPFNTLDAGASTIASQLRGYAWFVPDTATAAGKIKITRNGGGIFTSNDFVIVKAPVINALDAAKQCPGYATIEWNTVKGATDYEVMMMRGGEMIPVATTAALNYTFSGLSKDSVYWLTVRARINGKPGRRATAISVQPNSGTCSGSISDNDLAMDSLLTVTTGRQFSLSSLSNATEISVRIKNLDDVAATSGFILKYKVDNGSWIPETVNNSIAPGATYIHNFAIKVDFSAPGSHTLGVSVENLAVDPMNVNDTITATVRQLPNTPLDLTTKFIDNIEGATFNDLSVATMGLQGVDRYDYSNTKTFGRVRSFVNTGIAYSGSRALSLDATLTDNSGNSNFVDGTFNLVNYHSNTDNIRFDFQFKNHDQEANADNKVWIRANESSSWISAYDLFANQARPGIFKRSSSIELSRLLATAGQDFSTTFQVRLGQYGTTQLTDNLGGAGYTFDDLRIYTVQNDMSMISIDTPYVYSCGLNGTVPVRITVRNTTNSAVTAVPVKYRIDGGGFTSVENISSIAANSSTVYTFLATANLLTPGYHLIEAVVKYPGDDFEENDTASVTILNLPYVSNFPYLEDFEASNGFWYTEGGVNSTWEYGNPVSPNINRAASGAKAWKTRLGGYYADNERSYLYSPCFDVSGMTNPTLSFSLSLNIEDCGGSLCDAAWMEYSSDGGLTWSRLGAYNQGTNWYNKNYPANPVWSKQDYTRWHVATTALPTGISKLRLRFVFDSDEGLDKDGIAVDDIHIYDNTKGIYDGATMVSPVTQTVPVDNNWFDFTSGGKLIASIKPNNQDLGSTDAQAYIFTGAVRNYNGQYYHNRNITVKPQAGHEILSDSATVRFYFLDTETESLIAATGCPTCTKPTTAYDLGVSKYSDPNNAVEDGDVTNSTGSFWAFINSSNVRKVPFDKGYYAEFKVKSFSEFWLNNGGPDNNHALPVTLKSFTAVKTADRKDVLLQWETATELDVARFEIEVAKSNIDFSQNRFIKIGEVASQGNSGNVQHYNFIDVELNKTGIRFYRLRIVDINGTITYSTVRPVVFNTDLVWQVFPNPSADNFNLLFQANINDLITIRVVDAAGRIVHKTTTQGTGYLQKAQIDLSKSASGLYLMEVTTADQKRTFKLMRQ